MAHRWLLGSRPQLPAPGTRRGCPPCPWHLHGAGRGCSLLACGHPRGAAQWGAPKVQAGAGNDAQNICNAAARRALPSSGLGHRSPGDFSLPRLKAATARGSTPFVSVTPPPVPRAALDDKQQLGAGILGLHGWDGRPSPPGGGSYSLDSDSDHSIPLSLKRAFPAPLSATIPASASGVCAHGRAKSNSVWASRRPADAGLTLRVAGLA